MAYIRRCTSLANGARGRRRISTDTGGVSGDILLALKPHVSPEGQNLISILGKSVQREAEQLQKEAELLKQQLQRDQKSFEQQLQRDQKSFEQQLISFERERALLTKLVAHERDLAVHLRLQILTAKGLNNTRGLFEHIQEVLAGKLQLTSWVRGPALWERILKSDASLAACIENCTKAQTVPNQALQCYNVYSVLSDHVHSGKSLAELQMAGGGTILYERGPLTSKQVEVFKCIAAAAKAKIQENIAS